MPGKPTTRVPGLAATAPSYYRAPAPLSPPRPAPPGPAFLGRHCVACAQAETQPQPRPEMEGGEGGGWIAGGSSGAGGVAGRSAQHLG